MTQNLIQEVTQSLLAIMVTAGAGYALLFVPNAPNAPITTALGLVLGWYFTKSTMSLAQIGRQAIVRSQPTGQSTSNQ